MHKFVIITGARYNEMMTFSKSHISKSISTCDGRTELGDERIKTIDNEEFNFVHNHEFRTFRTIPAFLLR